jgi:uncharacterized protein YqcC (DUF446 family)
MGHLPPESLREVETKVGAIVGEMKKARLWQDQPLAPEQYNFTRAFAMDTMSYNQWLQFVFVPRVTELLRTSGEFPSSSSAGTQAIREFDGWPEAQGLVTLLCEFDRIFN